MKQIVCLSHTPWQARPNRTQQLLARLSDAQVLFFEPQAPRGAPAPEQGRRMRSHITVYTLPAPLPPGGPINLLQRRALNRNAAFIRETMERHRFRDAVLWCTAPDQVPLLDLLPCRPIYDCHREWGDEYLDQESDLVSRCEVVFAASPGLVERLSPCSDNIALIPNGVNPLMFSRGEFAPPDALAALAGQPVLGRVGDLTGQVDLEPLLSAAMAQSGWTFLLIGRVTKPVSQRLAQCRNIVLTGPVSAVELPDYLSVCSVLFDLTREDRRGCDILPAHVYEYLATGKPIVLMTEPDMTEPFPDVIYTAYDATGFRRRCRRAMEEAPGPAAQRRREYAAQAAWALRADEISRILESIGLF